MDQLQPSTNYDKLSVRFLDFAQKSNFATKLRDYAEAMGEEERPIASRLWDLYDCPAMGRSAGAVIPALGSGRYSPGPNIVLPSWRKGLDPHCTINVF